MKIFYDNKTDSATLTASTENADFPVSNLQNFIPSKVWKTGIQETDEYIVFDLLTAQTVTACIIYNHNFDETETAIKVQGNSSNSWGSPAIDETLTYAPTTLFKAFTGGSYRYWRVTFTKANTTDVKSIGRVFLGDCIEAEVDFDGYALAVNDLSNAERAIGGQIYTEQKEQFRNLDLSLTGKDNATKEAVETMYETNGKHTPVFVQVMDSSPLNEVLYMRLTDNQAFKISSWNNTPVWDLALSLEEQI